MFELAWRLPLSVKLHDGVTKWLLRQVLYRHVPAGAGRPAEDGIRLPHRRHAARSAPAVGRGAARRGRLAGQGLLDPGPIRRAWHQHLEGRRDLAHELWAVLALQAWLDRWEPALGDG